MLNVVSQIKTVAECDEMITATQELKSDLELRKLNLADGVGDFAKDSVTVEAAITKVQNEISGFQALIGVTTDPELLAIYENEKKGAEFRLFRLEQRREKVGILGLHDREVDIGRTESEIAFVISHLGDLEAKKAELQAA